MNVYLIQSTDCLKPYAIQTEERQLTNSLKNYAIIHIVNRTL